MTERFEAVAVYREAKADLVVDCGRSRRRAELQIKQWATDLKVRVAKVVSVSEWTGRHGRTHRIRKTVISASRRGLFNESLTIRRYGRTA